MQWFKAQLIAIIDLPAMATLTYAGFVRELIADPAVLETARFVISDAGLRLPMVLFIGATVEVSLSRPVSISEVQPYQVIPQRGRLFLDPAHAELNAPRTAAG
jgi:hypothetical protein